MKTSGVQAMWRSLGRNMAGLVVGVLMGTLIGAFFPKPEPQALADNRRALEAAELRDRQDSDQIRELEEDNQRIQREIAKWKEKLVGQDSEPYWATLNKLRVDIIRLGQCILALRAWAERQKVEGFPPSLSEDMRHELNGLLSGHVPLDLLDPNVANDPTPQTNRK